MKEEKTGFGGWLIFFQLFLYSMMTVVLADIAGRLFGGYTLPVIIAVLAVLALALGSFCLILFYKRKKSFRAVFIQHGFVLLAYFVVRLREAPYDVILWNDILGALIAGIIIVIALFNSIRVNNTFIY